MGADTDEPKYYVSSDIPLEATNTIPVFGVNLRPPTLQPDAIPFVLPSAVSLLQTACQTHLPLNNDHV